MKHVKLFEQFVNEDKPEGAPDFHHASEETPKAEGRFEELSPEDLAAWLIKTRDGDLKRISGSLTQQVTFNKNEDPEYAEKMEKTRKEVYKQLDRDDLLDKMDEAQQKERIKDPEEEIKKDNIGEYYQITNKGTDGIYRLSKIESHKGSLFWTFDLVKSFSSDSNKRVRLAKLEISRLSKVYYIGDNIDDSILNEYKTYTGKEVIQHLEDITPEESDLPDYFINKYIKPNDGWELKPVDLRKLLKTDKDFAEYYKSGEERYKDDEVSELDLDQELIVYKGELLDGYSRASTMLKRGDKYADAFVLD